MIYLCPQRGCSGVHNLAQDDIGRTFTCNKCGCTLRFDGDGLRVLSPPSAPQARAGRPTPPRADDAAGEDVPEMDAASSQRSSANPRSQDAAPMSSVTQSPEPRLLDVLFTGLYALGASFVILFLFLPLIDRARLDRQRALIDAGDQSQVRLQRRYEEDAKRDTGRLDDKDIGKDGFRDRRASDGDSKRREEERKDWEREKRKLEETLEDMRTSARRSLYFYTWGMLFGYLILAFASAGFVATGNLPIRRSLGAFTLLGQILLVFLFLAVGNGFRP